MKLQLRLALNLLLLLVSSRVCALDTTHTHPLVTHWIGELIRATDSAEAYQELYAIDPGSNPERLLYWGTDFDVTLNQSLLTQSYLLDDNLPPYGNNLEGKNGGYDNVIDGVVQEDAPVTKVLSHFQHAMDGSGLNLSSFTFAPSSQRAMSYFNQAVARMSGYSESAKKTAYFEFGQALHHVEDMSSPAHIHNDPHLTLGVDEEKDDYEGWFLPQMKRDDKEKAQLENYFVGADTIHPVTDPWENIWGKNNVSSLVRVVYERTLYQGTLAFPSDVVDQVKFDVDDQFVITQNAIQPVLPSGELAEMFPCKDAQNQYSENVDNCLYWEEEDLTEPAYWRIKAVGNFYHQYNIYDLGDDWWAVEIETDPSASGGINQTVSYQGKFYIEQLARDNTTATPLGVAVVPEKIRNDFSLPWNINSNTTQVNTQSLLNIYAGNLLELAAEYGAGFTEYWYDVANTPPYLKAVVAKQSPDGNPIEQVVYSAYWLDAEEGAVDEYVNLDICVLWDTICASYERPYSEVTQRTLLHTEQQIKHIDDTQNLIIELTFNEPIKQITLLKIGDSLDVTSDTASAVKSTDESVWTVTVPSSSLAGLNGKLPLTVKAIDNNIHTTGNGCSGGVVDMAGGELDEMPDTPARRNTSYAKNNDGTANGVNCYPWFQKDIASVTPEDIAYSYEYSNGDQNHVLIFDASGPSATINVDLTL